MVGGRLKLTENKMANTQEQMASTCKDKEVGGREDRWQHRRERREKRGKGRKRVEKPERASLVTITTAITSEQLKENHNFVSRGRKREKMFGSSKAPLACFQNMLRARVYDAKKQKKSQMSMQIYA